jgi:hypothetical protein
MDCGQHFLADRDAIPSKMSSVPADLKDFIMGHIIMGCIIGVNRLKKLRGQQGKRVRRALDP